MLKFKNELCSFLAANPGEVVRRFANFLKRLVAIVLVCALGFTLSTPSLAHAEDLQISSQADEQSVNPTPESTPEVEADAQAGDGLEIGPEIIGQPVRAVAKPTVTDVFAGNKTISGKITIGSNRRKRMGLDVTIHVTVNRQAGGTEEKTVTIPPTTTSQDWTVTLDSELVAGDKVTVKQEFNNEFSDPVVLQAKKSLADQHKDSITMPTGEIWVEQYVANIVNADEKAEAIDLLKKANPTIAKDIKSVEFKITGVTTKTASYTVTYTDESKSEEIQAPGLIIKKVTDTSRSPEIGSITVVDNVVKGKLAGPGSFDGIKVQLVLNVNKNKSDQYSNENKCTVDKDSSKPVAVTIQGDGTFSYTLQEGESLTLDQIVGVSVKEPHKFVSCSTTTVKPAKVEKTEVRDPRKLTAEDKKAIDAAIRKAYTVNGESKLPNGTGDWDGVPAVIQFDDSGNVKIFSGNDVAGTWDPNNDYKFVPEKNPDGSVKVKDGAEPKITIPAKDLLKNIAPKSPGIAVDTNTGKVTITPPAYENPGDDTDLASYTITYKDADGNDKTVTLTRNVDATTGNTTWTSDGATVDANTGVVTLQIEDLAVGATITAKAKDKGGLEGDTEELESDPASKTLETATVSYDRNGGTGEMEGKTLNKGSKYKILDNAFTAPANKKFKTWKIGETEYAAGAEITVKENTSIQAIWESATIPVVEFVLPRSGMFSLNYVAGYAALLIIALTGVGYLRQNRRGKSTA